MLKEVGASGQISLGKKYAGQLFDAAFHPDGRVELVPMKAVPDVKPQPANAAASPAEPRSSDGWLAPERLAARKAARERSPEERTRLAAQSEAENKGAIDAMNRHYQEVGSMGWRIYEWRKSQTLLAAPEAASPSHPKPPSAKRRAA